MPSITNSDIIYAALLAFLFTWLIKTASRVFKAVISRTTEFSYNPKNIEAILERCIFMFPNENMQFNGATFTRGMLVQVVTINKRIIEGKFIGSNKDNVVCVVTDSTVIAQELNNIEEIKRMEG